MGNRQVKLAPCEGGTRWVQKVWLSLWSKVCAEVFHTALSLLYSPGTRARSVSSIAAQEMFCCWALCGCRVFFCFCFDLFFFFLDREEKDFFLFCFCFVIFLLWCVLCYTFHSCQNPPGILNTWRAVSCSFVTQLSALAKSLQLKIHWTVNCKSGSVGWLNFRHPPTWSRV